MASYRLGVADPARAGLRVSTNPLTSFLSEHGLVVLDGGLATALEARGHSLDSRLWSARLLIDAPSAIRDVHLAYLEAGADCITTASYQASFEGFRAMGLSDGESEDLLRLSVRIAVEARDDFWAEKEVRAGRRAPIVAASVGPYGAYLADGSEYSGLYDVGPDVLEVFHRRRFEVLASTEADLIACETIPSGAEAEVLLTILDETPDAWAWMSFSCRDGLHLHDGTPFADVVGACSAHERVAAVGVNCTAPRFVRELLAIGSNVTDLPMIAYPNSGETYDAHAKNWSGPAMAKEWLDDVDDWVRVGARIVGGCCRVGPDTIRGLRARVANLQSRRQDER